MGCILLFVFWIVLVHTKSLLFIYLIDLYLIKIYERIKFNKIYFKITKLVICVVSELNGNENPLPLRLRGAPKKSRKSNRYQTGSFWLNKNLLKNVNGLRNLADRLFEMADYLSWLDLSDNNLTSISDVSMYHTTCFYIMVFLF